MVLKWECGCCTYTTWAGSESVVQEAVQAHLLDHHRDSLYKQGHQFGWQCPDCSAAQLHHNKDTTVETFREHLYTHAREQIETGTHVATELGGAGNVVALASPNSPGTDNARIHFIAPYDVVVLVTNAVADRLRLLDRQLSSWPTQTVVLTKATQPLADIDDLDLSTVPLDIVQLDQDIDLGTLGEKLSHVVAEHESLERRISISFELLPELIDQYQLKTVFTFLHLLTSRFDRTNALLHFYWNPENQPQPTLNLLTELFDIQIEVESNRFVSRT